MQERFNGVVSYVLGEPARRHNAVATQEQKRQNRERIIAPLAGVLRQDAATAGRYLASIGAQPQRRVNLYVKDTAGNDVFAGTRAGWILRHADYTLERPKKAHHDRADIIVTQDGFVVRAFAHPDTAAVQVMTDSELLPDKPSTQDLENIETRTPDFGTLTPLYMVDEPNLIDNANKIMGAWREDVTAMVERNYQSTLY